METVIAVVVAIAVITSVRFCWHLLTRQCGWLHLERSKEKQREILLMRRWRQRDFGEALTEFPILRRRKNPFV